jgi:hypothetical protein
MDTLPSTVHVGMKVYDSRHKAIGTIDDLKFPENELDPGVEPAELDAVDRTSRPDTILGAVAEAFGKDEIPEPLRSRLLREGYIRLDTAGLLARDRYILPSQIATAAGDEVMLNVEKDDLIKRP